MGHANLNTKTSVNCDLIRLFRVSGPDHPEGRRSGLAGVASIQQIVIELAGQRGVRVGKVKLPSQCCATLRKISLNTFRWTHSIATTSTAGCQVSRFATMQKRQTLPGLRHVQSVEPSFVRKAAQNDLGSRNVTRLPDSRLASVRAGLRSQNLRDISHQQSGPFDADTPSRRIRGRTCPAVEAMGLRDSTQHQSQTGDDHCDD